MRRLQTPVDPEGRHFLRREDVYLVWPWSPEQFRRWGATIGPQTDGLVIAILASRPHLEQGFRRCLGVLKLYRAIPTAHAEAASARAVEIGGLNCKSISALIPIYKAPRNSTEPAAVGKHGNLRGPGYFH